MGTIIHDDIIYGGGGSDIEIDDTTTASNKVWSSQKISNELNTKLESIPIANSSTLGGVKIGSNINVAADGTISTHAPYSLPTASSSTKGGVTVGKGLSMTGTAIGIKNFSIDTESFNITSTTIDAHEVGIIRVYLTSSTQRERMITNGFVVGAWTTDGQLYTTVHLIAENQGSYGAIDVQILNTYDVARTVSAIQLRYAYWS